MRLGSACFFSRCFLEILQLPNLKQSCSPEFTHGMKLQLATVVAVLIRNSILTAFISLSHFLAPLCFLGPTHKETACVRIFVSGSASEETQIKTPCMCSSSSVQSLSCVWLFVTPWTSARQASLSITNSQSLLKLMSIKSVMPSNHLIFCCPLLLPPLIFPSIRIFSNESVLHIRWPKYWSFSFSISPSNEYSRLISFRMDRFDLLAVQGSLKSLLQHHSSKASILRCSVLFFPFNLSFIEG